MPSFSMPSMASLVSWRTVAILFALANLKNLPFAWHLRLFYHFARNFRYHSHVQSVLSQASGSVHPLFRPVSMFTSSPLLETDYNLHKSNSTYFSDLDISRTQLVTSLLSAGFRGGNAELERQGYRGKNNVILGSVHTSFHKEVRPYERYEVRSRILGWDEKWIVILTTFIRPAKEGRPEVLLASALSKYVIKKARYTVPPETCFRSAGWLPEKPAEISPASAGVAESAILVKRPDEQNMIDIEQLERRAEEMSQADASGEDVIPALSPSGTSRAGFGGEEAGVQSEGLPKRLSSTDMHPWDWATVEKERLRGLEIASNWLSLDKALSNEALRVPP